MTLGHQKHEWQIDIKVYITITTHHIKKRALPANVQKIPAHHVTSSVPDYSDAAPHGSNKAVIIIVLAVPIWAILSLHHRYARCRPRLY